ncbi:MAG: GNAT family N-acetyltransferase [Lachnospiraceae bacterium]|nr:GNAT family N-acetyltransferase [Lachnospiraceae bacterium]
MEIRYITQDDDRFAISRIYEESWKFAYKDIIPESYLNSIPAGQWVSNLEKADLNTLIMIEDDTYIGTSSFCKSRFAHLEGFGEIVSIYFLPDYIGRGYGKQMLKAVICELAKLGYQDIFLWVLEENYSARKFYEKFGFVQKDKYLEDNIGGKKLREVLYCYHVE